MSFKNVYAILYGVNARFVENCCLTITNPKIHEHSLTYIRRKLSVRCDACGFVVTPDVFDMFGCLQCDFFLHRSCVLLPRHYMKTRRIPTEYIIKLACHSHYYLSHVFHILDDEAECGVCKGRFRSGNGGYACIDKTCHYVVHSTCATNSNVWDGIDHVKRELEEGKSMSSMKNVGSYVKHVSFLLIWVLSCVARNAVLPSMKNVLAYHRKWIIRRYIAIVQMNINEGFFTCSVCKQMSCGFMYRCCQEDCWFEIDVKCASFTDPFKHTTHRCPLYLRLEDHGYYLCRGCHVPSTTVATCTTCEDSSFDFKCLNLPPVIRYKYDVHPLYLYSGTEYYKKPLLEKRPDSWCDVCEKQILEDLLFYVCFDCRIALHVTCILGNYPYMKPGHNIKVEGLEIQIASNSGACRPMCHSCGQSLRRQVGIQAQGFMFLFFDVY
ncbi:unnamed protein product [Brassica oleracea var. botrytis]